MPTKKVHLDVARQTREEAKFAAKTRQDPTRSSWKHKGIESQAARRELTHAAQEEYVTRVKKPTGEQVIEKAAKKGVKARVGEAHFRAARSSVRGVRVKTGKVKPLGSLIKAESTAKAPPKLGTAGKLLRGAGKLTRGLGRIAPVAGIGIVAAETYAARKRGEPLPGDIAKNVIKRAKPLPRRKR